MSTENAASGGELEPAPVVGLPNLFEAGEEDYSAADAARSYEEKQNPTAEAAEAPAETSEAKAEDAAPEGTTAEDAGDEPALPAIDPPKSWSKEAHERWSKLDRETQEYLAARDSDNDKAIKRSLNEAAEARKAAEAERTQAEQQKIAYEAKLPALMQALQDVSDREFPDIKSIADYERLALEAHRLSGEDPFKALQIGNYLKAFDAHQQKLVAVNAELQKAEGDKRSAIQKELDAYRNEQDKAFLEFAPELADPKVKAEITDKAIKALKDDFGFTEGFLNECASNPVAAKLLFHSGFQKLIYNTLKLSDLKAAPAKAIPKPVPAVQKPGVAAPRGAGAAETVQASRNKLASSGSVEDAFALYMAKQRRRTA